MITKTEVLKAIKLIEAYKKQQLANIKEIERKEDQRSISILGLKTRELNCLRAMEIETIGDLLSVNRYELQKFRNLGKKGIIDINQKLKKVGVETQDFIWS